MSEISSIGPTPANRVDATSRQQSRPERAELAESRSERGEDRVEVSSLARLLQRLREVPDIREELVDRVRSQIESGTYLTDERLDAAVDAMIDEERAAGDL